MTLRYDLYWSFRSPYSYMITDRLLALEQTHDVVCNVRPVYPLAVRTPEFFETRDPLWFSYFMQDIHREAAFLGLPFRWPMPDPVLMDYATRTYPKEQPHIHRLTHLGVAAAELGHGLAYLREVSHVIWSGAVDNWPEGDHLDRAAERAGLDPAALSALADGEAERLAAVVEVNQVDQRAAGHYGVPMIAFNGEAFFGQDRFDQFRWRLDQQGLKPATPDHDSQGGELQGQQQQVERLPRDADRQGSPEIEIDHRKGGVGDLDGDEQADQIAAPRHDVELGRALHHLAQAQDGEQRQDGLPVVGQVEPGDRPGPAVRREGVNRAPSQIDQGHQQQHERGKTNHGGPPASTRRVRRGNLTSIGTINVTI
ncbi:hypothetical protein CSW58_11570 [Caulobacter sp. B11]|uniref:2-hydroxychromene-2-carboxylate isomerase n=1 Tax=Caulobacter sp. B11 TaxID=2048899 RepID=UPI000C12E02C|nr:DsbA family protein [Caulobacter sp. B11]PHY12594.1 hypothetical protein CSW58_11570 [Caulobacter sp. B11]